MGDFQVASQGLESRCWACSPLVCLGRATPLGCTGAARGARAWGGAAAGQRAVCLAVNPSPVKQVLLAALGVDAGTSSPG
jgi:hypothetical protein